LNSISFRSARKHNILRCLLNASPYIELYNITYRLIIIRANARKALRGVLYSNTRLARYRFSPRFATRSTRVFDTSYVIYLYIYARVIRYTVRTYAREHGRESESDSDRLLVGRFLIIFREFIGANVYATSLTTPPTHALRITYVYARPPLLRVKFVL